MTKFVAPLYVLRAGRRGYEVSVMKALMDLLGMAGGPVRPPLAMLKPEEIVGPVQLREPSYPVAVALQRQTMRAHGAELSLEPDLQLQADILSERRTLLAWVFEPVLRFWRHS